MNEILLKYLPEHAVAPVFELIKSHAVHLKIVNERQTRHGDYRKHPSGKHQITVNANLNKYRFLMTLVHEIAHLVAFEKYGRNIKPHGFEWKITFQQLMIPFLKPEIFVPDLLPLLLRHFKNPTASSDSDAKLALALKRFDLDNEATYVFELPFGATFRFRGRLFKIGTQRVKRFECLELSSGKTYLFNPNAEVEIIRVSS